jgi:hypothetical protein
VKKGVIVDGCLGAVALRLAALDLRSGFLTTSVVSTEARRCASSFPARAPRFNGVVGTHANVCVNDSSSKSRSASQSSAKASVRRRYTDLLDSQLNRCIGRRG